MCFQQRLDTAIRIWNSSKAGDEWLFQRIREEQVGQMSSAEAWSEIEQTVSKLLNQRIETTATELLETIIALAIKSTTTEIPKKIISSQERLRIQFSDYGSYANEKLNELFQYYRL